MACHQLRLGLGVVHGGASSLEERVGEEDEAESWCPYGVSGLCGPNTLEGSCARSRIDNEEGGEEGELCEGCKGRVPRRGNEGVLGARRCNEGAREQGANGSEGYVGDELEVPGLELRGVVRDDER